MNLFLKKRVLNSIRSVEEDAILGASIDRICYLDVSGKKSDFADRFIFLALNNGTFWFFSKTCMDVLSGNWMGDFYVLDSLPDCMKEFTIFDSSAYLSSRKIIDLVMHDEFTFEFGVKLDSQYVLTLGVNERELSLEWYHIADLGTEKR